MKVIYLPNKTYFGEVVFWKINDDVTVICSSLSSFKELPNFEDIKKEYSLEFSQISPNPENEYTVIHFNPNIEYKSIFSFEIIQKINQIKSIKNRFRKRNRLFYSVKKLFNIFLRLSSTIIVFQHFIIDKALQLIYKYSFLNISGGFFFIIHQLKFRYEQILQILSPKKKKFKRTIFDKVSPTKPFSKFSIFLCVFVDIICGILFSVFILNSNYLTINNIRNVIEIFVKYLLNHINWLMTGNPAGFKLNREVDDLFGRATNFAIKYWYNVINVLLKINSKIYFTIFHFISFFGFSFFCAFLVDIFTIFTLHFTIFYYFLLKIYYVQLHSIISLWRVFRGKKNNPLKKRIDKGNYNVQQFILSTILLSICVFLFPTVFFYYISFAIFLFFMMFLGRILYVLINIMNKIPLLLSILKDPSSDVLLDFLFQKENVVHMKMKRKMKSKMNLLSIFRTRKGGISSIGNVVKKIITGNNILFFYDVN